MKEWLFDLVEMASPGAARWKLMAVGFCALGSSLLFVALSWVPREELPRAGMRKQLRSELLDASVALRACHPAFLWGAGIVRELFGLLWRMPSLRGGLRRGREGTVKLLVEAGQPAGLSVHELWFSCAAASAFGLMLCGLGPELSPQVKVVLVAFCGAVPIVRLRALRDHRLTEAGHELPATIDLIALAMGAGVDFPGAVRRVTDGQKGVVAQELQQVLNALDLGMTRSAALRELEQRLPITEVRDLVRAVILAERKGASVAEAMQQQAVSSRQRRSVRAEEAAARAGVMLMLPLVLLLGCIMILLLGPLATTGVGF